MLQKLYQIAQIKGGQCLSGNYATQKQMLLWQCKKGHKWYATGQQRNACRELVSCVCWKS